MLNLSSKNLIIKNFVLSLYKELCDAGLIAKRGPGGYALGPRVIELDWMMRKYDPVLSTGRPYLENLSQITGLTVFVSAFYDSKIINTFILSPTMKCT